MASQAFHARRAAIKRTVRRRLVQTGLRDGSYTDRIPDWMSGTDEWVYIDEIANRHWRPRTLGYKTSRYGDDVRLKHMLYFLDVRDQRILELGPRSGHHTVLLDKMGAREIVGIEARAENVERCNLARERFRLPALFVRQDLERLASGAEQPQFELGFDLVFNLGLLYHLADPYAVLRWGREMAPTLFLGTHYVEPRARRHYKQPIFQPTSYRGQPAIAYREGGLADPRSGTSSHSIWLFEDHLLQLLAEAGYTRIDVLGKDEQSWHPHITVLAS
jgi:2-polyprenyl-3-methyl-5-hydroxy-6-metoxy-1,4-benzoquinol methylase